MKFIRNGFALILCLTLLLSGFVLPASAEATESHGLKVETAGGRRGAVVSLAVTLEDYTNVAGANFTLQYDVSALELISAEQGTVAGCVVNGKYNEDQIRVSYAGTSALREAATFCILTFRIRSDAPLGLAEVSVTASRFYDVNAYQLSRNVENGGVEVQYVHAALSSAETLPGQSVQLALSLSGGLAPAGGNMEIRYNPAMITGASVKTASALNGGWQLSYSVDTENGVIRIAFAGASALDTLGDFCSVVFNVAENAAGMTTVTLENLRFRDENGHLMDCDEPEGGIISIVLDYNAQPTLYMVGGKLCDDGRTAVVDIAVDGAGIVCGGSFRLSYEADKCTLTDIELVMGHATVNPEIADQSHGALMVSWASGNSSMDNQTILRLTFTMKGNSAAALELSDAILHDQNGLRIGEIRVQGGMIGIHAQLQAPDCQVYETESGQLALLTLYDAQFCSSLPTDSTRALLAAYANGRMKLSAVSADQIRFNEYGIAAAVIALPDVSGAEEIQIFLLDTEGHFAPLCEKITLR